MEQSYNRYTAKLLVEQKVVYSGHSNNIRSLTCKILDLFEDEQDATNAFIFDNHSGDILLQCDKLQKEQ